MLDNQQVADRIKQLAKAKNISLKIMLSDLGLGINTISQLPHRQNISLDVLKPIAQYLGCSTEYLLGFDNPTPTAQKEKPASPTEDGLSADEAALIQLFHQVPPEDRRLVLDMIRAALKNR